MPTRRTVRQRPKLQRITPAAVATFKCLLATNDATEYDLLLDQLHDELDLRPWQGPAIVHPDEDCPYPRGTAGYEWWPQAQALYRLLWQASLAKPAA
jgi:hypothetical protein